MKCEYCGRRVPGRLVIQGIKNCQGCGAKLPEPYNQAEMDDFLRRLQVAEHFRRYNLASENWVRKNVLSSGDIGITYVAILEEIESRSRTDRGIIER